MLDRILAQFLVSSAATWWSNRKAWQRRIDALRRDQPDLTVDQATACVRTVEFVEGWMRKQGGFDRIAFAMPDALFLEHFKAILDVAAQGEPVSLPSLLEKPGVLPLFREYFHLHECAGTCGQKVWHAKPCRKSSCVSQLYCHKCTPHTHPCFVCSTSEACRYADCTGFLASGQIFLCKKCALDIEANAQRNPAPPPAPAQREEGFTPEDVGQGLGDSLVDSAFSEDLPSTYDRMEFFLALMFAVTNAAHQALSRPVADRLLTALYHRAWSRVLGAGYSQDALRTLNQRAEKRYAEYQERLNIWSLQKNEKPMVVALQERICPGDSFWAMMDVFMRFVASWQAYREGLAEMKFRV